MVDETENSGADVATADSESEDNAFAFVDDPTFEVDYKGDCAYEVKVSVPASNAKKQAEELFEELRQDAELPGFRKGRAPIKLLEKKFAKVVKGEVHGKLVSAAFDKLVEDEDLKPSGMPDVDGLEELEGRADEDPLAFTLKFEVAPRVELGKYRGIDVERPVIKLDDEDVNGQMEEIRGRYAVYEELEGGVAAEGDQVIIDFKGTIDGEEFSGGAAENYPYILGSNRFFPEFESALAGASPKDELTCDVTFPEDYFAEELRGKKAQFAIQVHDVKRKSVPELTDDFAEEAGYENAENMLEVVKARLTEATEERSTQIAESRALDTIVESSTFEIPQSMIKAVGAQYFEQELRRLSEKRLPSEEHQDQVRTITENMEKTALSNIKTMVVLNEIGEAEGIEVSDDDFEKEAENMAKGIGGGANAQVVAQYMSQGDNRSTYVDRIYRAKSMAVIMDNATITDKELTREELDAEEEAINPSED